MVTIIHGHGRGSQGSGRSGGRGFGGGMGRSRLEGVGDHKGPKGLVSVVKISHKCFKRSSKCENL